MKIDLKKYSHIIYFLIIFFISLFLLLVSLQGIKPGEFLFIHDGFLSFKEESLNLFFTRNPIDFGYANTIILIVSFFDRLYYFLLYSFHLNLGVIQHILYFIEFFFLTFLPYQGFKRLAKLYLNHPLGLTGFFISLWYSFNTYSLIYLNGNGFPITLLICYSLAPLALYYYHKSIFGENNYLDKLKSILVLFLMSFALYLFVVFIFLIFIYTILYAFLKKIKFIFTLKNLLILLILYLPLLAIHFLAIYDMFINVSPTVNLVGSETFGNLQGSFLYPLLMWFSWGIYTIWEPRNFLTFYHYFQIIPSLLAPFVIYILIFIGIIKRKKDVYIPIFIFLFLLCLLFVKGAQEPFGGLYLFLIKNVSFFRVFRSPDNKFGFGIVFTISILLLLISREYKKKIFIPLLSAVILIQGWPLFTGIAIKGENTPVSSDRVLHITQDYQELVNFLNKNSQPYGYIIGFPSTEFDHYELGEGERHIGQDLLPKLTSLPFLYISESSGMLMSTYRKLLGILNSGEIKGLREFPIRYFIARNDIRFQKFTDYLENDNNLAKEFNLVFSNPRFNVYENLLALPLIRSNNITFKIINPVKYQIFFKNLKQSQLLYFYQNYHQDWKLYLKPDADNSQLCGDFVDHSSYQTKECRTGGKLAELDDFTYLIRQPLFDDTHTISDGYANAWTISPEYIKDNFDQKYFKLNPDGSIDFTLVLFFRTQATFYAGAVIATLYFLTISLIILFKSRKNHSLYEKKKL